MVVPAGWTHWKVITARSGAASGAPLLLTLPLQGRFERQRDG